jgi:hypothetical protein
VAHPNTGEDDPRSRTPPLWGISPTGRVAPVAPPAQDLPQRFVGKHPALGAPYSAAAREVPYGMTAGCVDHAGIEAHLLAMYDNIFKSYYRKD